MTPSDNESAGTITIRAELDFASTEAVSAKYATATTNGTGAATGTGSDADFVEVTTPTALNFATVKPMPNSPSPLTKMI